MELLKALLFGILEGITEWLPVSSTGHLILLDQIVHLSVGESLGTTFSEAFASMFDVVIQLGAIGAVLMRYFRRLFPFFGVRARCRSTVRLYGRLAVSGIPAAVVGILGDRLLLIATGNDLDGLLYRSAVVAAMLIAVGAVFLIPEAQLPRLGTPAESLEDVSIGKAFGIGCFQALSIVPGVSRSGATILGGMMLGLPRATAAEYSFLLAIPTMAGASLLKVLRFAIYVIEGGIRIPLEAYAVLAVGMLSAFLVSLLAIDFLLGFVRNHSFVSFGIYRILLGIAVLLIL